MCQNEFMYENFHYAFNVGYYRQIFKKIKELENSNEDEIKDEKKQYLKSLNQFLVNASKSTLDPKGMEQSVFGNESYSHIDLKTAYPGLLVGAGNRHESKQDVLDGELQLGFTLDYVSGLPYIPGSSVKGILRAAFAHTDYIQGLLKEVSMELKEEKEDENEVENEVDFDIEGLKQNIFDGIMCNQPLDLYHRDIFYDAVICGYTKNIMCLDAITPHAHKKGDYSEPVPINFLKVGPEVKFRFQFKLFDYDQKGKSKVSAKLKQGLFERILLDLGAGAKTNVGYGVLEREELQR